jgi:two-component system chemotaxis response regulator CheY
MELSDVKVLIVEDVYSMRVQLKDLLLVSGFVHVDLVINGESAMKYLEKLPCDLVLSDWHMHPISGIELLKWIRKDPKLKQLPFIMISAEKSKNYVVDAVGSGVDSYLIKPVSLGQVETKIIDLLIKKKVIS